MIHFCGCSPLSVSVVYIVKRRDYVVFIIAVIFGKGVIQSVDVGDGSCGLLDAVVIRVAGFPHRVGPVSFFFVNNIVAYVADRC